MNFARNGTWLILVAGCSLASVGHVPTAESRSLATQDTIWVTVLNEVFSKPGTDSLLLINDSTSTPIGMTARGPQAFGPRRSSADSLLVRSLVSRNSVRGRIDVQRLRAIGFTKAVAAVTDAEVFAAGSRPSSGEYAFDRFPGAHFVVSLSQVGFDANQQRALVHTEGSCGPRCGGGTMLIYLVRTPSGSWQVESTESGVLF